jgi:hypothetical protein
VDVQTPLIAQACPAPHATEQPPHFARVSRGSQAVPVQAPVPWGQTHTPAEQVRSAAQAYPHVPQLAGSTWRNRQAPLQTVPPDGQTQVAALHTWPATGQALPQVPQSLVVVWRLAQ